MYERTSMYMYTNNQLVSYSKSFRAKPEGKFGIHEKLVGFATFDVSKMPAFLQARLVGFGFVTCDVFFNPVSGARNVICPRCAVPFC